jgi:hypothetical protein
VVVVVGVVAPHRPSSDLRASYQESSGPRGPNPILAPSVPLRRHSPPIAPYSVLE